MLHLLINKDDYFGFFLFKIKTKIVDKLLIYPYDQLLYDFIRYGQTPATISSNLWAYLLDLLFYKRKYTIRPYAINKNAAESAFDQQHLVLSEIIKTWHLK